MPWRWRRVKLEEEAPAITAVKSLSTCSTTTPPCTIAIAREVPLTRIDRSSVAFPPPHDPTDLSTDPSPLRVVMLIDPPRGRASLPSTTVPCMVLISTAPPWSLVPFNASLPFQYVRRSSLSSPI
jgi:hypothetical protein